MESKWLVVQRIDTEGTPGQGDANEAYLLLDRTIAAAEPCDLGVVHFGAGPLFFEGVVVDVEGRGIAGAAIRIQADHEVPEETLRSDAGGRFQRRGHLTWEGFALELAAAGFFFEERYTYSKGETVRIVGHRSARPRLTVRGPAELEADDALELVRGTRSTRRPFRDGTVVDFGDVPPGPAVLFARSGKIVLAHVPCELAEGEQELAPLDLHGRTQRVAFAVAGANEPRIGATVSFWDESQELYCDLHEFDSNRELLLFAPALACEASLTYGGRTITAILPRLEPIVLEALR